MRPESAKKFSSATFYIGVLFSIALPVLTIFENITLWIVAVVYACILIPLGVCSFISRRFWRCPSCNLRLPAPAGQNEFNFCPYCRTKIEKTSEEAAL